MTSKDVHIALQFIKREFETLREAVRNQRIVTDISGAATALDKAAGKLETSADVLQKASKTQNMDTVQRALIQLGASVANMAKSVGAVKPTDMQKTNALLSDVIHAVARIKLDVPKTDVSRLDDVAALLVDLRTAIMELPAPVDRTDEVIKAIKAISITLPDSMKLDASSLATVRYGGGGGATGGYASEAHSANLSMPLANTQYSHRFSSNTIGFRIKLRSKDTELLYSWQTGTLPTSGTGAAYSTVQEFGDIVRHNIDVGNKLIYLQTAGVDQVAEIEEFILA